MADIGVLAAQARSGAGKGIARAARRAGQVPAVIYGNNEEPVLITVDDRELRKTISRPGFFIHLMDIDIDGAKHRVLPRDTQLHPVTDAPLHVDFLRYNPNRKLTVEVPVTFLNEDDCPGLREGGMLNIVRHAIEIQCTADAMPEGFEIDLSGLVVGDSIHASALALTAGVELTITDRDFTIATIAAPTVAVVEVEGEGEGDGEGEGEGAEDDNKEEAAD
ncbi:MAG: large subunit ribosomal protein L25 [Alphaproteobacteria bacterium]|jgi:large subunit ribosomal protein L25